jgi:hypothetical protein
LFWRLVLVTEVPATRFLRWSRWRRWHQAWARYYHYRRRGGPVHQSAGLVAATRPEALLEVVWRRLTAHLPPTKRKGRPYAHDRRVVLEAIMYVMQSGCTWQMLPCEFPPWQTVYAQLTRWRRAGIWDEIWTGLDVP